jgi:hypothetical protein
MRDIKRSDRKFCRIAARPAPSIKYDQRGSEVTDYRVSIAAAIFGGMAEIGALCGRSALMVGFPFGFNS